MALKPKTTNTPSPKKAPNLSFGTLTLIETKDGDLRIEVNIEQSDRTSEALMDRLRATLCGLQYVLNHNEEEIHGLGEAFIAGMETGIRAMGKSSPSLKGEDKPTMGFHAEL